MWRVHSSILGPRTPPHTLPPTHCIRVYGGFIKGILRGVRCTKSLRVLFLHRRPPSWTTLVLHSRAVFIFNEPAYTVNLFTQGRGSWTREKGRGETVHKAGSKIPTWLTVSPVYSKASAAKSRYRSIFLDDALWLRLWFYIKQGFTNALWKKSLSMAKGGINIFWSSSIILHW